MNEVRLETKEKSYEFCLGRKGINRVDQAKEATFTLDFER